MAQDRRQFLRTVGGASVGLVATVGVASGADTKENSVQFKPRNNLDGGWRASGPDPNPDTISFEAEDTINSVGEGWTADGIVNGLAQPRVDEIQFDGPVSELTYDVDSNVEVIVNGVTQT